MGGWVGGRVSKVGALLGGRVSKVRGWGQRGSCRSMYTTNIGQEPPLPTTVAFTIMSWRISKPANILACPFCMLQRSYRRSSKTLTMPSMRR